MSKATPFILSLMLSFSKELFPFIIKEIKICPKWKEKFAMHSHFQWHTELDCTWNWVLIKYSYYALYIHIAIWKNTAKFNHITVF